MGMIDSGGVESVVIPRQAELLNHPRFKTHKQLPGCQTQSLGKNGTEKNVKMVTEKKLLSEISWHLVAWV